MQAIPILGFLTQSYFPHHFHGICEHTITALIVGSVSYFFGFFYITAPVEMPAIALERLFTKSDQKKVTETDGVNAKKCT